MGILDKKLYDYMLRAGDNITPPILMATVKGTTGNTTYSYRATFVTLVGESTPTEPVTVTDGNASLSSENYIQLSIDSAPAAAKYIRFYKLSGQNYYLLQEVPATQLSFNDTGQQLQQTYIQSYTSNTSGRPQWRAVLFNPGKYLQRQELIDMQWILLRSIRDLGNITHRNGDVISGCVPTLDSGTTWKFSGGQIYIDGQIVDVPPGSVTLTGTGEEVVGILITPEVVSHIDDHYLRNQDEGVDLAYAADGADRLVYAFTWGKNQQGQLDIQKFVDGIPIAKTISPERTELMETLARRTAHVSGDFVTAPFQCEILAHETDSSKIIAKVHPGIAYVNGYEVNTFAPFPLAINKGRDTASYQDAMIGGYESYGGSVLAANEQNYNVDGLHVKLKIGSGYAHDVTLSGSGQTAAQVATQINNAINARKTAGQPDIITCSAVSSKLFIRAQADKTLEIMTVTGDAYSILGLSTGTYYPTGTRIYSIYDEYVKAISRLSYSSEQVISLTYNGTIMGNTLDANVYDLVGASIVAEDCHDGYFDYKEGTDFRLGTYQGQKAIIFDLGGSHPTGTYYLKLRESRSGVKGVRTLTTIENEEVVRSANSNYDNLAHSDVVKILKIATYSGGPNAYTKGVLKKNSDGLQHNISQVDWSAASTEEKPNNNAHYFVTYTYWAHTVEGDFVSADSYSSYEDIELAPDGTTNLRDCIDFRTTSTHRPENGEQTTFDYQRYLPRFDKITIADDGTIGVITGVPAIVPTIPLDQPKRLGIVQLYIPPYTYSPSDIIIKSVAPVRTTQAGIRDLAGRIDRLEYWQTVNDLENQTAYSDAAVGAKGIFTDPVTGQNKMSWSFDKNGVRHTAAIDARSREVKLPVTQAQKRISVDEENSENIDFVGNYIVKGYQPTVFQQSTVASIRVNLNPDNVWDPALGRMTLSPGFDLFSDMEQLPVATVNYDNNMAAILNLTDVDAIGRITWGAWNPTGQTREDVRVVGHGNWQRWEQELQQRQGDQITGFVPETQTIDLGDRVADVSLIQYCRTKDDSGGPFYINVTVDSLMINTDHGCEIAGIPVDFIATGSSQQGSALYRGKTTVRTNGNGSLTGKFVMPAGVPVGSPLVVVCHASDPTLSSASAQFHAGGLTMKKQGTVLGLTSARVNTTSVSDTQWIDKTLLERRYIDPVAQTFPVEDDDTYISEVHVYFAKKSSTKPVTCEIRSVLNGYPTSDVIQSVTLPASEILTSTDASVATVFKFTEVVSYQRGWYAVILMTDCTDYEVWVARLGDPDITTGNLITTQAHSGVFFHSPNGSTWQPETKQDLKMIIKKSNFEQDASIVFSNLSGIQASYLVTKIEEFTGPGVQSKWYYSLDDGVSWVPFKPWIDTYLGTIASNVRLKSIVSGSNSGYALVKEFNGVVFLLHETDADYISNQINFTDPNDLPNQVVVYLDAITDGLNGSGARSITPYYSVDDGETWCEMTPPAGYNAVAKDFGFWEYRFETQPTTINITGATNASPIVITAVGHGFKTNERVIISGVVGNTAANNTTGNPYWVITKIDDNSFSLNGSTGSGSYVSGGTVGLATMDKCRLRVHLQTSNQATTPVLKNIRMICSERTT